jgi:2-dehydro-3-deoxyphosphogluconate aldolase/(4S)-4-hydroxy-2-oxoglutarate aldolase
MSYESLHIIIQETPVVAIVRRPKVDPSRCIKHFFEHGLRLVEITMDTPNAVEVIETMKSHVPPNALLGAGTVTDVKRAETALAAGASFLVTPNVNLEVIRMALENDVPILPGAMSPTEIWTASSAGAEYIKIFPASSVGPRHFRELRGPFSDIKFVASGGINMENARDFMLSGSDALGVGGSIVPKSSDQFDECAELIARLIDIARKARSMK